MLQRFLLLLLLGLSALRVLAAPVEYRKVVVRVVDERGRPMAGVPVQLLGTGRDALQALDIASGWNELGVWRFVSDARGECRAQFACCVGWDSEKVTGRDLPGWGEFYFIAESGGRRGVSQVVIHEARGEYLSDRDGEDDEWTRMGFVKTQSRPTRLTLRLLPGLTVGGRVIDLHDRPVPHFQIRVQHDLHSGSHTGYGDEIFQQTTETDEEGRFSFRHVYPNTFYVVASASQELPVWVDTELRGRWKGERIDMITPRRWEKRLRLNLRVSPKLPYRFSGQVVDSSGAAVPGAKVTLAISKHPDPRDFGDEHNFQYAVTDDDGRFLVLTAAPFCRFVSVKATGYADYEKDFEDSGFVKAPMYWPVRLRRP